MQTENLIVDRDEAVKMFRKYQQHKHHSNPVDLEVMRIYGAIAKGKVIVRALESIRKAGLGTDGLPKLAIIRADAKHCYVSIGRDGSARMADMRWISGRTARNRYIDFPPVTFVNARGGEHSAIVPHIPPDIRPKRGLQNYHILWEAVWTKEPPRDPLLLRRIGKSGDMWLVCGAWDLTDVERAVMADRLVVTR